MQKDARSAAARGASPHQPTFGDDFVSKIIAYYYAARIPRQQFEQIRSIIDTPYISFDTLVPAS
jgi:hypothetical protein